MVLNCYQHRHMSCYGLVFYNSNWDLIVSLNVQTGFYAISISLSLCRRGQHVVSNAALLVETFTDWEHGTVWCTRHKNSYGHAVYPSFSSTVLNLFYQNFHQRWSQETKANISGVPNIFTQLHSVSAAREAPKVRTFSKQEHPISLLSSSAFQKSHFPATSLFATCSWPPTALGSVLHLSQRTLWTKPQCPAVKLFPAYPRAWVQSWQWLQKCPTVESPHWHPDVSFLECILCCRL